MNRLKSFLPAIVILTIILSLNTKAQISLGIKAGPNYAWYVQTRTDFNKTTPGWGVDAGLVMNAADDHTFSFRSELLYSLQSDSTEILRYYNPGSVSMKGKFYRHNLLLSAQLQINLLKQKKLFLNLGPYFQYTVASSGDGIINDGFPYPFSGNEGYDSRKMFTNSNVGATLALGVQKIKAGKVSFFGEIRQNVGFLTIYHSDYARSEWLGCITTVSVGIEFYRSR